MPEKRSARSASRTATRGKRRPGTKDRATDGARDPGARSDATPRRSAVTAPSRRVGRVASASPAPEPKRRGAAPASLVAVDVGNTETTVGLFSGEELRGFWRLTSGRLTADEVDLTLESLLRRARGNGASPRAGEIGAVLCSVAPTLTMAWVEALTRLGGRPPVEVNAATARSLPIRYRDKAAVGADRIANAVAARGIYGTPAIVVDLGTATTFDCISREGAYLGGVIAPGLATSAEELFRRAARIPRVELRKPARVLGRTTEESLQAGVIWGAAGQVDTLVRRLALEMKGTPHVIATGGFANAIASECETINRVDEALTLKGMRLIWEEAR